MTSLIVAATLSSNVVREWPRLKAMRKAHDVEGLLEELENRDELMESGVTFTIRERAIVELAELGDPRAIAPTCGLLADAQSSVRTEAAMALGKYGDQSAVPALVGVLSDEHDAVRMWAAKSLGKLRARSATSKLTDTLRDKNPYVRMAAARSLALIGDQNALAPLRDALRREGFRHPLLSGRLLKALLRLQIMGAEPRRGF